MLFKCTLFLLIFPLLSTGVQGGDLLTFFEEIQAINPSLIGAVERLELSHIRYRQAMGDMVFPVKVEPLIRVVEGEGDTASFQLTWQLDDLLGQDRLSLRGGWRYALDAEDLKEEYSLEYSILLFPPPHLMKERAQVDYYLATQEYLQKERTVLKEILEQVGEYFLKKEELAAAQYKENLLRLLLEKDEREYQDGLILPVLLESSRQAVKSQENHVDRITRELLHLQQDYQYLTGQETPPPFLKDLLYLDWESTRGEDVYLQDLLTLNPSLKEGELRLHVAQKALQKAQREAGWQTHLHFSYGKTPTPTVLPDWEVSLGFHRVFWGRGQLDIQEQELLVKEEKRRLESLNRELERRFVFLQEELLQLERELDYLLAHYERAQQDYWQGEENLARGFLSLLDFQEVLVAKKEAAIDVERALWQRINLCLDIMDLLGYEAAEILSVLQEGIL